MCSALKFYEINPQLPLVFTICVASPQARRAKSKTNAVQLINTHATTLDKRGRATFQTIRHNIYVSSFTAAPSEKDITAILLKPGTYIVSEWHLSKEQSIKRGLMNTFIPGAEAVSHLMQR